MIRVLCLIVVSVYLVALGTAGQFRFGDGPRAGVAGKLTSEQEVEFSKLRIKLSPRGGVEPASYAIPSFDGVFRFDSATPGLNELAVTNRRGTVIYRDFVMVGDTTPQLRIELPELPGAKPVTGLVSVAELQHQVPRKAQKEFAHAARAHRKGKPEVAAGHLRRALEIDPLFGSAHSSLGVILLKSGNSSEALAHLQKAVKLAPSSAQAFSNAAVAYSALGRHHDAEMASRHALELDPTQELAEYIFGVSLLNQGRPSEEAVQKLRHAASRIPKAWLVAAEMLEELGRIEDARRELRSYIRSGEPDPEGNIALWISRLRQTEPNIAPDASNLE